MKKNEKISEFQQICFPCYDIRSKTLKLQQNKKQINESKCKYLAVTVPEHILHYFFSLTYNKCIQLLIEWASHCARNPKKN